MAQGAKAKTSDQRLFDAQMAFVCAGVTAPYKVGTIENRVQCVTALQNVKNAGTVVVITDAFKAIRGERQAFNADMVSSLAVATQYTDAFRQNGKDKLFAAICPDGQATCNTNPLSPTEVSNAFVNTPNAPTFKNRGIVASRATAAVMGYLAADIAPLEYIKGWGNTVAQAATELNKDKKYDDVKQEVLKCLANVGQGTLESCARMGIRLSIMDEDKRGRTVARTEPTKKAQTR